MGNESSVAWTARAGVVVRRAWPWDAEELAPRLRDADLREIAQGSGRLPLTVCREGVEKSELAYALIVEGQCEAIFGVRRNTARSFGVIWLLGSPWLSEHPRVLYEGARKFLPILLAGFDTVGNMISNEQEAYIRFLDRLGFSFQSHPEYPEGWRFFSMRSVNHV